MKITNRRNLPFPLVAACAPREPRPDRISVTQLIGPPRIRTLSLEHWDEIEEDAADRLWAVMGSAMHALLEQHGSSDALTEERLEARLVREGASYPVLSGRPDYYDADGVLWDWKFTSLWALKDGVKPEWSRQLNVYAWLFRMHSFEVKALRVCAVFRDWSKSDAMKGLPPAQVYEVEMLEHTTVEDYICARLDLFASDPMALCTPEERWDTPPIFAVMKQGNKRAIKLCDTREDAEREMIERGTKGGYVQERPGRSIRCEQYCPVAKFCDYGRQVMAAEEEHGDGQQQSG